MGDIKKIAEALVKLNTIEAQEMATVLKSEYGIEAAIDKVKTQSMLDHTIISPKDYGIKLLNKRNKRNKR